MQKMRFVIFSIPQSTSGGALVLHYLCKLLQERGYDAKVFLSGVAVQRGSSFQFWTKWLWITYLFRLKREIYRLFRRVGIKPKSRYFAKMESEILDIPIKYSPWVSSDTIVVYPEIVNGNPLRGKRIVRWFLHIPGYHTHMIEYGKNELYFAYLPIFNSDDLNPENRFFQLLFLNFEMYKQTNFGKRQGKCYIVRKGRNREDLPKKWDGIIIDNLEEEEIIKIFNSCAYCISYDTNTFYSHIASMCGCIPIVMPEPGVSEDAWQPIEENRYGIAYGDDTAAIEYALRTREIGLEYLRQINEKNKKNLDYFIDQCSHFPWRSDA